MKILSRILLLVLFACLIVMLNKYGPGHVIIFANKYRLDIALSSLIIITVIAFVIIYYLIRFSANVINMPNKLREWRVKHQLLKGRKLLNTAGVNYFEGRFDSAYKNAISSIDKETNKENQFMALMLAYKASGFIGDYKKEEGVLLSLEKYNEKKWMLAKCIAIAENQYNNRMYAKCLDNLNKAISLDKKHIEARRIKLKTYMHLHNYDKAFEELRWLIKNNSIDPQNAMSYKLEICRNLFEMAGDEAELKHFYNRFEKADRDSLIINKFYMGALIRLKLYNDAINLFEQFSDGNLGLFDTGNKMAKALENDKDIEKLEKIVSSMLFKNSGDAGLLLMSGICRFKLKNYFEARKNLEDSLTAKLSLDGLVYLMLVSAEIKDDILYQITKTKLELFIKNNQ